MEQVLTEGCADLLSCCSATLPAALRIACSAHSPRTTVDFVIYKLAKRVNNPSWLVALKALMTFHRLLRECDASFAEQVRNSNSRC
jgi:hypothetical protein